jgi:putative copper export protein
MTPMHPFDLIVIAAVLAVVAFQGWLTHRVFKSSLYERKQKIAQAQLIWLLPILGAGLVFSVLQQDSKAERDAATHLKNLKS